MYNITFLLKSCMTILMYEYNSFNVKIEHLPLGSYLLSSQLL